MGNKFKPGDRVWGRNTGWNGVQYVVEKVSDEAPYFRIQARSMNSGRLVTFNESQVVRCNKSDVKRGAWELLHEHDRIK